MKKGTSVAFRAMDVLVAALHDASLCPPGYPVALPAIELGCGGRCGQHWTGCREYVAHLCCKIVQNQAVTSQMAMKGAFAIFVEVIGLFPRPNFAMLHNITREAFIHDLQVQYDMVQACLINLRSLIQDLERRDSSIRYSRKPKKKLRECHRLQQQLDSGERLNDNQMQKLECRGKWEAMLGIGGLLESDDVLHTELWTRLGQLRYLIENAYIDQDHNIMLESCQVDRLWRALNGSTACCLRWLRLATDSGGIFSDATQAHIFRTYVTKMNPATIQPHACNCFQAFFADVNSATMAWKILGRNGGKVGVQNQRSCLRWATRAGSVVGRGDAQRHDTLLPFDGVLMLPGVL
jgi:hypothetical protein